MNENSGLEVQTVDFNGAELMVLRNDVDDKVYVGISSICKGLELSKSQKDSQVQLVQNDIVLKQGVRIMPKGIFDQNNITVAIDIKFVPIWLSKINTKSLTENKYKNIILYLNYFMELKIDDYLPQNNIYHFESHLRDEIFEMKKILDINIIDKEVIYDFGRIDLLGIDKNYNSVCIELKKGKEFQDTKQQLLRYKNSNKFNRMVYIANKIDCDLKTWCNTNNIEAYLYERKLIIKNV